jgi:hypothetical protein
MWERSGGVYYAVVRGLNGDVLINLAVRPNPEGAWDYTVWRRNIPMSHPMEGTARAIHAATLIAEEIAGRCV